RPPSKKLRCAPEVWERPWVIAFVFGLVHGFGFAGVLGDLGVRPGEAVLPLLEFNLGVEVGQLACVALFLPVAFCFRRTAAYRRAAVPLGSAAILLFAGGWLVERAFNLGFMPF
ncbi:MAG: HupE/UreJ family protein, partial [Verrucomicrobiae bacterium]|nr:HupE/UreJ family protein [Verrucomicrobiae bacterium]